VYDDILLLVPIDNLQKKLVFIQKKYILVKTFGKKVHGIV